jgi:hypothetical protein
MSARMSERQKAFFRELLFPFPTGAYYTSRGYTYLKARTIKARLDDVVGPLGWRTEYKETDRGYTCTLWICCPGPGDTDWVWHDKTDGAGTEGMTKKAGNETVEDEDNDEKSAYTNAFRRVAADWGFGRELYREGVPRWLSDLYPGEMRVTPASVEPAPAEKPAPRPDGKPEPRPEPSPEPRPQPAPPEQRQPERQRKRDLRPPTRPGKACYAWLKQLEDHFKIENKIVSAAIAYCKSKKWSTRTDELDAEQLAELTRKTMDWIKTWDNYDGEFDGIEDGDGEAPLDAQPSPGPKPTSNGSPDALAGIKKSIVAQCRTLVQKRTGRDASEGELMACIGELASMVKNGGGHSGEVLESLRGCDDKAWLLNIQKEAMKQIERAAVEALEPKVAGDDEAEDEGLDDIPF